VLKEAPTLSREERVAEMRRKIAEAGDLAPAAPALAMDEEMPETVVEEEVGVIPIATVQQCPNYATYTSLWTAQGITFGVAEGTRVVSRLVEAESVPVGTAQEVLLQLPLYPIPGSPACLGTDVVGIAHDGSLIKNNEVGLYGVFGEQTLIGYALDGFAIYGMSEQATDICGGVVAQGEYRYYLSDTRETILNCFTATPVAL
jgi:hypothetical protein